MTTTTDWTQAGKLIEVVSDQRVRQYITGTSNWAAAVCQLMADATRPAQQPSMEICGHQYQDRDGKWCNFINEEHYRNTVADGSWPIREIYTAAPQPAQQAVVKPVRGWKLVPVEPTPEMLQAGRDAECTATAEDCAEDYRAVYGAMLAAAPQPAQQKGAAA